MTAVAVRQSPTDVFVSQVLPPEKRRDIARALPAHVPIARFERNLVNAVMANPDLLQCDPRLVFREVSKIAALGLLMDPQLGEAYLIVGWNARKGCKEPQSRVGYKGLMKLARQSGEIATLYAHEVCEGDHIECELGLAKKLVHKPDIFGERGEAIGYYAVVHYKDGGSDFEPMNRVQIDRIRDRSDGWKAFKNGKIKGTPWGTDYDEMAKKTVLRRLLKRLPQSPDLAAALAHEDAAEDARAMLDVTPQAPAAAVAAALAPPVEHDEPQDDAPSTDTTESADSNGEPSTADASDGAGDTSHDPAQPPSEASQPELDAGNGTLLPPWDQAKAQTVAKVIIGDLAKARTMKAVDNILMTREADLFEVRRASAAAAEHIMKQAEARKQQLAASAPA